MKLKSLLTVDSISDARFATLELGGVSADSRTVKPGDLFVAVAGAKDDGLRYVGAALAAGAAAIMAERVPQTPLPPGIATVRTTGMPGGSGSGGARSTCGFGATMTQGAQGRPAVESGELRR